MDFASTAFQDKMSMDPLTFQLALTVPVVPPYGANGATLWSFSPRIVMMLLSMYGRTSEAPSKNRVLRPRINPGVGVGATASVKVRAWCVALQNSTQCNAYCRRQVYPSGRLKATFGHCLIMLEEQNRSLVEVSLSATAKVLVYRVLEYRMLEYRVL